MNTAWFWRCVLLSARFLRGKALRLHVFLRRLTVWAEGHYLDAQVAAVKKLAKTGQDE